MTTDRAQAYGRVMQTLSDIGATKLLETEQQRVRDAADALLFADTPGAAREATADAEALTTHLADTDRWSAERADQLLEDLLACGPVRSAH